MVLDCWPELISWKNDRLRFCCTDGGNKDGLHKSEPWQTLTEKVGYEKIYLK